MLSKIFTSTDVLFSGGSYASKRHHGFCECSSSGETNHKEDTRQVRGSDVLNERQLEKSFSWKMSTNIVTLKLVKIEA